VCVVRMRSTLRFIGEGADYKSRALFGAAQDAHQQSGRTELGKQDANENSPTQSSMSLTALVVPALYPSSPDAKRDG